MIILMLMMCRSVYQNFECFFACLQKFQDKTLCTLYDINHMSSQLYTLYMYICMYVRMYMYNYIYVLFLFNKFSTDWLNISTCIYMYYVHTYVYACMYIYTCTCIYIYIIEPLWEKEPSAANIKNYIYCCGAQTVLYSRVQ